MSISIWHHVKIKREAGARGGGNNVCKVDRFDPVDGVHTLFGAEMKLKDNCSFPVEMKDKTVATKVFFMRSQEVHSC